MLAEERLKQLQELINTSTKDELIWINGYLSGLVKDSNGNGHATVSTNGNGSQLSKPIRPSLKY